MNKMRSLLLAGLLVSALLLYDLRTVRAEDEATGGPELWSASYGTGEEDEVFDMAVGAAGDILVTGKVAGGAGDQGDIATIKYNPSGGRDWVKVFDGSSWDESRALLVDQGGNVYVTGCTIGDTGFFDFVTLKYGPGGQLLWKMTYDGSGHQSDQAYALALDASHLYVLGSTVNDLGQFQVTLLKYAVGDGDLAWEVHRNGDIESAIAADGAGNVFLASAKQRAGSALDFVVVKYGPDLTELWASYYTSSGAKADKPTSLALAGDGSVYVTGYSAGAVAIARFAPDGSFLWAQPFGGPIDEQPTPGEIAVDGDGNAYVTGTCWTTYDSGHDYALLKYSPGGDLLWERYYDGPGGGNDFLTGMALDGGGNVYITGTSPGISPQDAIATLKYSPDGKPELLLRHSTSQHVEGKAVALDQEGNIVVSGSVNWDFLTLKYPPEPGPLIFIEDAIATEGNAKPQAGKAVLNLRLLEDVGYNVSVAYQSTAGSASEGVDYEAVTGTVNINKYNTSATITVPLIADTEIEDNEVFYVDLSMAMNARLVYERAQVTIREDDNLQRWAARHDGPGGAVDSGKAVAVDRSGNVVVAGSTHSGNADWAVLLKYDPDGNLLWERSVSGDINDIGIDGAGNVYTGGMNDSGDLKLVKFDSQGNSLWERSYSGPAGRGAWARELALDPMENVVLAGTAVPTGGTPAISMLTVKYDPQGNLLWAQTYADPFLFPSTGSSLLVDSAGGIITAGKISASIFAVKYSPAGEKLWEYRHAASACALTAYEIGGAASGGSGFAYLVGKAKNPSGQEGSFVIKISPSGVKMWESCAEIGETTSVAVDHDNNVYAAGYIDYSLVKLSPAGKDLWTRDQPGLEGILVAVRGDGNVFLTGTLYSPNTGHNYVTVAYDPDGEILWQNVYHGTGAEQGAYEAPKAIVTDGQGNVYITGDSQYDIATLKFSQPKTPLIRIDDISVVESVGGVSQARFTVRMEAPLAVDAAFDFRAFSQTAVAGFDFEAAAGSATIPAGGLEVSFEVPVLSDGVAEPNETFFVKISSLSAGGLADSLAICTILDSAEGLHYLPLSIRSY